MFISESIHDYAQDLLDFERNFYKFRGNEPSIYILIYNKKTKHVVDIFPSDYEDEAKDLVAELNISGKGAYDCKSVNLTDFLRITTLFGG